MKVKEVPMGTSERILIGDDKSLRNVCGRATSEIMVHFMVYVRMFFEFSTKFDLNYDPY
jgi:hypothetical protein